MVWVGLGVFELREKLVELMERLINAKLVGADEFDDVAVFGIEAFFEFVDTV